jgi:hypothetical protein
VEHLLKAIENLLDSEIEQGHYFSRQIPQHRAAHQDAGDPRGSLFKARFRRGGGAGKYLAKKGRAPGRCKKEELDMVVRLQAAPSAASAPVSKPDLVVEPGHRRGAVLWSQFPCM